MTLNLSRRIQWLSGASLLYSLCLPACTGQVGDNGATPPTSAPGGGQAQGSESGTGAGTGGAGSMPSGGTGSESRDSGRVTMRRLNRIEYDNTVRDLLGTTQQPGRGFLNDAPQFGFDNNADQLTLSPTQLEMYQKAAESLAAEAISGATRAKLVTCDLASGEACLTSIVTNFGMRAFRRPLLNEEVSGFVSLAAQARTLGATPDEALRTVVEAVLLSPHFLFRVEVDPDFQSTAFHPVGQYEMASRLSYLVYRSMPDQALFDAAAAGKLSDPSDLQNQVVRMLGEPAGKTFARDFVGQWLGTRLLETAQFDPVLFSAFNAELAASMQAEVAAFFEEFVRENRPVQSLINADFSYLDSNLARHYKLPAPGTGALERSTVTSRERMGGILTMAGPLTVTSYATRTSVVKRGHWVLEELLCSEPPPPPPDVVGFPDGPIMATSQRQLLAMHRASASCNSCHETMDNIGLALENYDAIGAYRTSDASGPIDARGNFPDGTAFDGARALASVLAQDARLAPCVAKHMLSYALGRSLGASDAPYVQEIAGQTQNAVGVRDLLTNIVASDTFRLRRGEPEGQMGVRQ